MTPHNGKVTSTKASVTAKIDHPLKPMYTSAPVNSNNQFPHYLSVSVAGVFGVPWKRVFLGIMCASEGGCVLEKGHYCLYVRRKKKTPG